jgi:hypothetical protein
MIKLPLSHVPGVSDQKDLALPSDESWDKSMKKIKNRAMIVA